MVSAGRYLPYGMARHHQAFLSETDLETNIFRDFQEAKKWLGVDIDDDELRKGLS